MASFWNNGFIQSFPLIGGIDLKILLVFTATLLVTVLLSTRKNKKLPPGPIGLPIFGYLPFLANEPFKILTSLGKKYGGIYSLYLGRCFVVILNDWDGMKEAFSKTALTNTPPNLFDLMPGGFGFSDASGIEWMEQRKFSMKTMKDIGLGGVKLEGLIQEEVRDLVKSIEGERGKALDVKQVFFSTFTSIVMATSLGKRLPFGHPEANFVSECVDAIMKAFPTIAVGNFMPWVDSVLSKFGFGDNTKLVEQLEELSKYVRKVIDEKLKDSSDSDDDYIYEYRRQMLSNLKNNVDGFFTERNLQGNIHSLLVGGGETTRTVLTWLLLALAQNPDVQKKVQEELDRVVGKDGTITWGDRRKLPYTYATIMEALRWSTIVPINKPRLTYEDLQIRGYDIPKGALIIVNHWALHHDPRYWPEPYKFIPDRFLLNEGKEINFKPESYVPFSYGKRNCPGELLSLTELLLYFTALMQKFEVLPPDEGIKHGTHLGLSYQATGVKLRFVPRD